MVHRKFLLESVIGRLFFLFCYIVLGISKLSFQANKVNPKQNYEAIMNTYVE